MSHCAVVALESRAVPRWGRGGPDGLSRVGERGFPGSCPRGDRPTADAQILQNPRAEGRSDMCAYLETQEAPVALDMPRGLFLGLVGVMGVDLLVNL